MKTGLFVLLGVVALFWLPPSLIAQTPSLVQGSLIAPGSTPFHLRATITESDDTTPLAQVEMYWVAPDQWRRTIESQDFRQVVIVSGATRFESDSDDYFPLALQTLVSAMFDPKPLLAEYRPGDMVLTKANGQSSESGLFCFDAQHKYCLMSRYGLLESVSAAGHSIELMSYEKFDGKRVARRLVYTVSPGNAATVALVTELEKLKSPDENLFRPNPGSAGNAPIKIEDLSQEELMSLAVDKPPIIWPQTLDGAETGQASFYVSIDPQGHPREIHPVQSANERTNDSAIRQLMQWKFQPAMEHGQPVQAEGLLTFSLNTREFGPPDPLTNEQMRKMASTPVDPVVPAGTVPPGTTYQLRVAVDSDGNIIEEIAAEGPPDLFGACDAALKQWHFKPIMENGQPRPYRGLITFTF